MLHVEPTCCLDFAKTGFVRHTEPERFLEGGRFGQSWIEEVDPLRLRKGFAVRSDG